ncbi:MAG: hypothetical protein AB8B91_17425 [Rubripirellula sp.]
MLRTIVVAAAFAILSQQPAQAGLFGKIGKIFGCQKEACCEAEPECCEPEPEPECCEPEPEPEPECCEPAPEPEPECCTPEPAPEPEPECCEPAPEPEPCCASLLSPPELAPGETLVWISPVLTPVTTAEIADTSVALASFSTPTLVETE